MIGRDDPAAEAILTRESTEQSGSDAYAILQINVRLTGISPIVWRRRSRAEPAAKPDLAREPRRCPGGRVRAQRAAPQLYGPGALQ